MNHLCVLTCFRPPRCFCMRAHVCLCGFDLTLLMGQRPGPPPSRPPPRLTPSPDQRQQHVDLSEDEANTDFTTTTTQKVRLINLHPAYF